MVIDLVAVDTAGRFIADLRPDEIDIREGGKPQPVQLLRLVGPPAADASSPGTEPAEAPPGEPSGISSTTGTPTMEPDARRVAIVVDALSLPVDAVPRLRDALLTTITDLPDDVPVMLATIGTELVVRLPFTTDRQQLATAVAAMPAQLDTATQASAIFEAVDRVCAAAVDTTRVVQAAIEAGERLILDANERSRATSAALVTLATHLGTFAGRKHLVFYSAGHSISPATQAVDTVAAAASACTGIDVMTVRREAGSALGRLATRDASDGLRVAISRANGAQVSVYTIDPAGVTTTAVMPSSRGSAQTGGAGPPILLPGLRADAGRDYLQGLAAETGGLRLTSNDLGLALRRAWEDASRYYLVGYAAREDTRKGPAPKITLSVRRRGVRVRYRTGYISPSRPEPADTAERDITAAFADPARHERDDLLVSHATSTGTLSVEVLIPRTAVRFTGDESGRRANFTVHAELQPVGRQDAAPIPLPGKDVALTLTPEEYTRFAAADHLRVVLTAPAPPPGAYTLVAVARDEGGWLAARRVPCCETGASERRPYR